MNKKAIVSITVVCTIIVAMLISFWTLFGLSVVEVEFSTTLKNLSVSEEEIVEAGQFNFGECVLFANKDKAVENITNFVYQNENFAYIRILNIETKFPNKYVVHVAEREEFFAIKIGTNYAICDKDLRVLRFDDAYVSTQDNAILLEDLQTENKQVKVGDFLKTNQTGIKNLYGAFAENNRNSNEAKSKFSSIKLLKTEDSLSKKFDSVLMTSFSGREFQINNIDFALSQKIQKMYAVETALFSQQTDENGVILDSKGEKIYLVKTESGEYQKFDSDKNEESEKIEFTFDLLSNCIIKIDNLTLSNVINRTENDIYYTLREKK